MKDYLTNLNKLYGVNEMVDVNQYYESKSSTLKAAELPPNKEVPVTIASIEEGDFKDNNLTVLKRTVGQEKEFSFIQPKSISVDKWLTLFVFVLI